MMIIEKKELGNQQVHVKIKIKDKDYNLLSSRSGLLKDLVLTCIIHARGAMNICHF